MVAKESQQEAWEQRIGVKVSTCFLAKEPKCPGESSHRANLMQAKAINVMNSYSVKVFPDSFILIIFVSCL